MCGIIGIVGRAPVAPLLVDGLRRLEYRGGRHCNLDRRHHLPPTGAGLLANLGGSVADRPGGRADQASATRAGRRTARRQKSNQRAPARRRVASSSCTTASSKTSIRCAAGADGEGLRVRTETDTEVVVHLMGRLHSPRHVAAGGAASVADDEDASKARSRWLSVRWAYRTDDRRARRSPLAIGYGEGEMYLGSDALALAPLTSRICYLEEGDWAEVAGRRRGDPRRVGQGRQSAGETDRDLRSANRQRQFAHFMLKEMYESRRSSATRCTACSIRGTSWWSCHRCRWTRRGSAS